MHKQRISKQNHPAHGRVHPAVQIYMWICLALATQTLDGQLLLVITGLTIFVSVRICAVQFLFLLHRTRWILFSVVLIYAYTGHGDALWPQLGAYSPVGDGVASGLLQLSRLVTVLAGLSILLTLLTQAQLISGIYILSRPLAFLGLSRDRVAVRLALTLRYAESTMKETARNWQDNIEYLLAPVPVEPGCIELHIAPFSWRDWLLFAAVSAALLGVWL